MRMQKERITKMDLQYVKYLKYGNSLIHVGTKEEFVFDKMD